MESLIQVLTGSEVIMGCAVQGSPIKNVSWIDNKGKVIKTDWRYQVNIKCYYIT